MGQNDKKRKCKVYNRKKRKRKAYNRDMSSLKRTLLLTFIGLLLTFSGLVFGVYQYIVNNSRQKKADTIAYLQTLHELLNNTDESLLEILKFYDTDDTDTIDNSISSDSLSSLFEKNHTYRKQLDNIMIGFNQLAIGCQEGFFDEMTIWSANYQTVVNVTKALIPYYELIEQESGRSEGHYVCFFLRNMAYRWENDMTLGNKYNKMIKKIVRKTNKKTNDDIVVIKRNKQKNK